MKEQRVQWKRGQWVHRKRGIRGTEGQWVNRNRGYSACISSL